MKFKFIMADPNWSFKTYSGDKAPARGDQPYEVTKSDQIASLPVNNVADEDCVLYLWGTWPLLLQCLKTGEQWGFKYKTLAHIWIKINKKANSWFMGLGYWTRANCEPAFLFVKGNTKNVARKHKGVRQIIVSRLSRHSAKPEAVYKRVEQLLNGPYLELYGREKRLGWIVLGDEVDGLDIGVTLELLAIAQDEKHFEGLKAFTYWKYKDDPSVVRNRELADNLYKGYAVFEKAA